MKEFIVKIVKCGWLRKAYLGLFVLSLFGYAVLASQSRRDNLLFGTLYDFASFPREVKKILIDVSSDGNQLLLSPDEFSNELGFQEIKNNTSYDFRGIKIRTSPGTAASWRMMIGIFNIGGNSEFAALAISPELAIEHVWLIDKDVIGDKYSLGGGKYLHGFTLMEDSSIIFSFDDTSVGFRMNRCGDIMWKSDYRLHHAIYPVENEKYVWSLHGDGVVKIDTATGELVKTFSLNDLVSANSEISVFDIRRQDDNGLGANNHALPPNYLPDPVHFNDVEPLPDNIADKYPGFNAGDLLISARSLNLIVVIDPDSLKIKWKMVGMTKRQHDPDWGSDGNITVLDNRMGLDFSRIISINPTTNQLTTLLDGKNMNFYTRIRGKHQMLADGGIVVTSSQQGHIFEVNSVGKRTLEILVTAPEYDNSVYVVSDAFRLSSQNFTFAGDDDCAN